MVCWFGCKYKFGCIMSLMKISWLSGETVFRNREFGVREFGGDISVEIIPVVMNGRALSK